MRFVPLDRLAELDAAIERQILQGNLTQSRDAIAVALGLHGMRVNEVCRATVGHLHVCERKIYVPKFKRGDPRELKLHPGLVVSILNWRDRAKLPRYDGPLLATRRGTPVCYTQFQRAAWKIIASVLGERLKFHTLRHTFAMRVYAATRDLFLVKRNLGHRSIKSTQVYADTLDDVPDSCLVKVAGLESQVLLPPLEIPGAQLKLFSGE